MRRRISACIAVGALMTASAAGSRVFGYRNVLAAVRRGEKFRKQTA